MLVFSLQMVNDDVFLQRMKKIVTNLNMVRLAMLHRVVGDLDNTLIIAEVRDFLHVDDIVLEGLLHP